jgi:hypothetical protein
VTPAREVDRSSLSAERIPRAAVEGGTVEASGVVRLSSEAVHAHRFFAAWVRCRCRDGVRALHDQAHGLHLKIVRELAGKTLP